MSAVSLPRGLRGPAAPGLQAAAMNSYPTSPTGQAQAGEDPWAGGVLRDRIVNAQALSHALPRLQCWNIALHRCGVHRPGPH